MRTRLSSYDTLLYQFVLPAFWLLLLTPICYLGALDAEEDRGALPMLVGNVALTFGVAAWLIWNTFSLKKVVLEKNALRISGWLLRDTVPLTNVQAIRRGYLFRYSQVPTITLEFAQPTMFGEQIRFILTGGRYQGETTHRILQQSIRRATPVALRKKRDRSKYGDS